MSDLISRQAAIEAMIRESTCDGAYGYVDTYSAVKIMRQLPAVQQWIPCSERLPGTCEMVLVFENSNYNCWVAVYDRVEERWILPTLYDGDQYFDESDYENIVAWMPLPDDPEPYKGVE